MLPLKINSPASVVEGESYLIRASITNQSFRAEIPVEATFEITVYGDSGLASFFPLTRTNEYFSPGQSRSFDYSLDVPLGAGGKSGDLWVILKDPLGRTIATATEHISVTAPVAELATLFGVVTDAATGEGIWGALVAVDGISTLTGGDGSYLLSDLEPGLGNLTFTMEGYEVSYHPDVMLLEGNNEFNVPLTIKQVITPESVTIDSLKIMCDFPNNIFYTLLTITNHTNLTFIDETPTGAGGGLVTQLWATGYPPVGRVMIFQPREWDGFGVGNVPPGTHTYRGVVHGSFFKAYGVAEGAFGHSEVFFRSMDEKPTPIEVFIFISQMFEGIFSSAWQEWVRSSWEAPESPYPRSSPR